MESKGHFCYGCNEYFHDSQFGITTHKGCKGKKSLGICVDSKEYSQIWFRW
jgi:Ni,Fe-hydrogenase I small subunit